MSCPESIIKTFGKKLHSNRVCLECRKLDGQGSVGVHLVQYLLSKR